MFGSVSSSVFSIGMILDIFDLAGNSPDEIDELKISANTILTISLADLTTWVRLE